MIFYDRDEEENGRHKGREHAEQVIQSLRGKAKSIKLMELPGGLHDVSDHIESFSSPDEANRAIAKLIAQTPELNPVTAGTIARTPAVEQSFGRVAKIDPPQTPVTIEEWRKTIVENFRAVTRPAEICASVVTQLLLNDVANPFALVLLDVPSSGKTITENFFDIPHISYTTDHFTPASLVSNTTNVPRTELAKVDTYPGFVTRC